MRGLGQATSGNVVGVVAMSALMWCAWVPASYAQPAKAPTVKQANGTLTIAGAVPGAEVYVDGELVGQAPLPPMPLSAGNHTVRVTRPGFTEFTEVVHVRKGKTATVAVEMMAVSMVLTVRTEPPVAQVFVDGKFAGESPVDLDLVDGTHALKVTKQYFRDALRTVDARAGETDTLSINLEAVPMAEIRKDAPVDEDAWYQQPTTWILVGGGAAVVAAGVVLAVVLSGQSSSAVGDFCKGGPSCVRIP